MFLNIMLFIAMLFTTTYSRSLVIPIDSANIISRNINTTFYNTLDNQTQVLVGGCDSTMYGCCQDNVSYCTNVNCTSCESII